jgi:hypothetical protein
MNTWLTVLTSAAVGALVSSIVTFWGQYLERGARRKELLLTKSLEVAKRLSELQIQTNPKGDLVDEFFMAEMYYQWLESLMKSGQLPPDAKKSPAYVYLTEVMKKSFHP